MNFVIDSLDVLSPNFGLDRLEEAEINFPTFGKRIQLGRQFWALSQNSNLKALIDESADAILFRDVFARILDPENFNPTSIKMEDNIILIRHNSNTDKGEAGRNFVYSVVKIKPK